MRVLQDEGSDRGKSTMASMTSGSVAGQIGRIALRLFTCHRILLTQGKEGVNQLASIHGRRCQGLFKILIREGPADPGVR